MMVVRTPTSAPIARYALMVALSAVGCARTSVKPRIISERDIVATESPGASLVTATYKYESGVILGTLEYESRCTRTHEEHWAVVKEVHVPKPDYTLGFLLSGCAVVAAGGAALMFAAASVEPDDSDSFAMPSEENPLGSFIGWGFGLSGGAIAGAVGSFRAFARTRSTAHVVKPGPIRRTEPEHQVPCGEGPLDEVGLALECAEEVVATTETESDGFFAMRLPTHPEGTCRLVIEAVPARMPRIMPGTIVANLRPWPGG